MRNAPPFEKGASSLPHADESSIRKILVIDDNREAADLLAELLSALGWEGKAAYSGEDGLGLLSSYRPDLVFLDIEMPGISGYDFVRKARGREEFAALPIVAVTGYGAEEDRVRSIQLGFTAHLVKPVSARDLREILTGDIGA
jgi:CheY-like chemotaxis protein